MSYASQVQVQLNEFKTELKQGREKLEMIRRSL